MCKYISDKGKICFGNKINVDKIFKKRKGIHFFFLTIVIQTLYFKCMTYVRVYYYYYYYYYNIIIVVKTFIQQRHITLIKSA